MQTTSISVVSEIDDLDDLHDIRRFIEMDCPGFICIDMTTALEEREGDYKDCVIPKQAAMLLTQEPLVPMPKALQKALSSTVFHVICGIVILVTIPFFAGALFLPREYRQTSFITSLSIQIFIYSLNVAMFKGKVLKEVAQSFEFWYLLGVQLVAVSAGAFLYTEAGTHWAAAWILHVLYSFSQGVFAYGIDASPWSTRVKTVFMLFFFVTYASIFVASRFVDTLLAEEAYGRFTTYSVDLGLAVVTPQQAILSAVLTLMVFYLKYAATMAILGQEYLLVWFEARDAKQEIGEIVAAGPEGHATGSFKALGDRRRNAAVRIRLSSDTNPLTSSERSQHSDNGTLDASRMSERQRRFTAFSNGVLVQSYSSGGSWNPN